MLNLQMEYYESEKKFIIKTMFFDMNIVSQLKKHGFLWNPQAKYWYTYNYNIAIKMQHAATTNAQEAINNYIKQEQVKQQQKEINYIKSQQSTSDINIPCPKELQYLNYQKAGIEYMLDKKDILLADEMGLGKTIQAIGLINMKNNLNKILIICPAILKINWQKELSKWLVQPKSICVLNSKQPFCNNHNIYIINYDILNKFEKEIKNIKWDLLICDEAHYLKNNKTNRTKLVLGYKDIQPIQAHNRLFITGTPILNRPIELWPIIKSVFPDTLGKSWENYAITYCNAYKNKFGWNVNGASNLQDLQRKLRSEIMIRRLKKDVLSELPDKRRIIIDIPDDSEILEQETKFLSKHKVSIIELQNQIKKIENQDKSKTDDIYINTVKKMKETQNILFTEMSKIRHDTALRKVDYVIEYINEILENQIDKIVVFAHHSDIIQKISDKFPDISVSITGQTNSEQREYAVSEFQNNPNIKIFIGSILASGVGITLTSASNIIFAELDWVPGNIIQAEDRCHRIGQKNNVNIYHLVINNSIDAKIARILIKKQEIIEKALNTFSSTQIEELSTKNIYEEIIDTIVQDISLTSSQNISLSF